MLGELTHAHFIRAVAAAGDRLWMLMGRPVPYSNAHKKIESYHLRLWRWTL